MSLNPKQQRFAREYLVDLNATQAAIRAGYSKAAARQQGSHLLSLPAIQSLINGKNQERAESVELTAASVIADLQRLALKAEAAEQFSAAAKCRELLGKHLRLFVDRVEHSGKVSLEQLVAQAAKEEP